MELRIEDLSPLARLAIRLETALLVLMDGETGEDTPPPVGSFAEYHPLQVAQAPFVRNSHRNLKQ